MKFCGFYQYQLLYLCFVFQVLHQNHVPVTRPSLQLLYLCLYFLISGHGLWPKLIYDSRTVSSTEMQTDLVDSLTLQEVWSLKRVVWYFEEGCMVL